MKRLLIALVIIFAAGISKGLVHTFFIQNNPHTTYRNQDKFQKKLDTFTSDINNEFNKFETITEAQNYASSKVKDRNNEIITISTPMGFFMQADVIKEFCTSAGYIPENYLQLINSYKKNLDLDEELIAYYIKQGLNREQAVVTLSTIRDVLKKQLARFVNNDYLQVKKNNSAFTESEYCKLYNEYAKDIISQKLNEIKQSTPNAYYRYFQNNGSNREAR